MSTKDTYHGNHTIEVKSGTLSLEGDSVSIIGTLLLSEAVLTDLAVTNILTASTIESNGLTLSLDGSSDGISLSSSSADIDLATSAASGDINISSAGSTLITADSNLTVTSGNWMNITSNDYIYVRGDGGNAFLLINSNGAYLSNSGQPGGSLQLLPDTEAEVVGTNDSSSYSQVLKVRNRWNDTQADGMAVVLEPSALSTTNVYVRFSKGGDVTNTAGRIRGPASSSSVAFQADGSDAGGAVDGTGDVVYASGGSDFGEWIEAGDIDEWNLSEDYFKKMTPENPSIGLPEGWVCYVRNKQFFKEGPGTPMMVTRSALLVGNETGSENFIGETFSFSGQVSAIVKGPVKSGDLLIPSGSYYCTAISPDNVTFEQYKKVIGTAWTSFNHDEIGRVTIAIGIKNTS